MAEYADSRIREDDPVEKREEAALELSADTVDEKAVDNHIEAGSGTPGNEDAEMTAEPVAEAEASEAGDQSVTPEAGTAQSPSDPEAAPRRSWIARFGLCCLAFLFVSGMSLTVLYVLKAEPFGIKALTIDDAKIQYMDFFTYYVDVLRGTRSLTYDFSNLLGSTSIGLFGYYLASPFNLLLTYFGKEGVYRFFDIAVILKMGTAGATFAWYLQRRFENRIRPVFVLVLSMGYGMMQYCVQQSSNIIWLDGVYMLPLILLGVYEVLHRKSIWRLSLAVAFCIYCNWYIAGVCCLFSGIWFFFEFFFRDNEKGQGSMSGGAAGRRSSRGWLPAEYARKGSLRADRIRDREGLPAVLTDFFFSFCRYVWGMVLGIALSAMLFLPVVSAMRQGTGQYDEIKFLMKMSGDLLSAVRGYVIGTESAKGYAALFCGGIVVSAAAALLFSGGFKIRQKIAMAAMLGICFLMLHWQPAMLAFSLMKEADSYWYRYGFLICFVLLFAAGAYLSRAGQDRWSKLFMVLASILFAAAVLKLNGIHIRDLQAQGMMLVRTSPAVFATAASAVILTLLTVFILSEKGPRGPVRGLAALLVLVVAGTELWANAWLIWQRNLDDSQPFFMEYSEGMQAQLRQLRAVDDGYYRIAQDRTRWHYEDDMTAYLNDSLSQNYWSNASYTSSQDDKQVSLMWRLGYRDEGGRMVIVRDPMIASDSFLGVKYMLQSTPVEGLEPVEGVDPFNGRTVYRNPFALPMAFVYDGSKLPTMRYDSTFVYQNELFSTLSGRKTVLYTPLTWTKRDEGNKSYYTVYIPKKEEGSQYGVLAYGNLLWPYKSSGLMSVNGAEPAGYCRWMSPAAFLIRSRQEQARSGKEESLQTAFQARQKAEAEAAKKPGDPPAEESELSLQKKELAEAAAAFDAQTLADFTKDNTGNASFEDVRTMVFRSDENLAFTDAQFYALDLNALRDVTDLIRAGEVKDVKIENGHVTANVDGVSGRSLCLLVPASKGWSATRNGEPVLTDTVAGAMITVPLVNGENRIELTYHVPYLREGMCVSAAALVVLLMDALRRFIITRRERRLTQE